jgi:carbamoyl-phosphate synthase/aspartate carbamoyltransferase/dihydroorotase
MEHFAQYSKEFPLVAHSESRTMAAVILMAELFDRPVHIAHISLREEVLLIRKAKERGIQVTCEVSPHHLFLSQDDLPGGRHPRLSGGRGEVRPRLATPKDVEALWENLDIIDCFATDHAPHTHDEKDSSTPPPGFPGLETALPLLLTAVHDGRLTLDDIINRLHTNPRAIFSLPEQTDTWVEIDPDEAWVLSSVGMHSRCAWTPFEGMPVRGKVKKVVLRGNTVYEQGCILAEAGSGKNLRPEPGKI